QRTAGSPAAGGLPGGFVRAKMRGRIAGARRAKLAKPSWNSVVTRDQRVTTAALPIRSDACELDFLALGALVHRLDPGVVPFRKARSFDVHVSGGEYNAAAGLADCFGLRSGIATAMVRYGIGELVQARVREAGVAPFYKWFDHDGVRGPNIATVYSDRGHGVRPPVVVYHRANEAGA